MAKMVLSERAKKDLRHIWHYTKITWSLEQARCYYNELLDTCESISGNNYPGSLNYDTIRPGLRGIKHSHHIIFYRVLSNNTIRILRVLHEKMDFQRHI